MSDAERRLKSSPDGIWPDLPPAESYATMTNRRAVVPSATTPYFAVEQHFFYGLMAHVLQAIELDEAWYLEQHSDVREAIRAGVAASARGHYVRFGFYEHRMPFPIRVAEDWYMKAYPDVRDAIERQDFPSAQAHFEAIGFREGRLPYAHFSLSSRRPARSAAILAPVDAAAA